MFHKHPGKIRLYIGGNRSGKTVGGIAEDIYYLRGDHPYKKVPPVPIRGRVVCVDFNQGIQQIIIPQLQQWVPPSLLINGSWEDSYDRQSKVLTLANKSTLELMSHEQKLESFAGTSRHFVHYDEEPPKAIYTECQARLIDTKGDSWLTLTPIIGMEWVEQLYDANVAIEDGKIGVIQVDIHENPYLDPEAVAEFLEGLPDDERKVRERGQFVRMGGRVYKEFERGRHVIPWTPELMEYVRSCEEVYATVDHGFNAPTAWLWHAVAKDGTVTTFGEHYEREMTVDQHAKIVLQMEKDFKLKREVLVRIADPATQQRQGVTGNSIQTEYAINGVSTTPGNNDVSTGVSVIQKYLRNNPNTGKPRWLIADNCPNLIREMLKLRWQTYSSAKLRDSMNPQEKIHKKDDHACDSARYLFATLMLDILVEDVVEKPIARPSWERYDEVISRVQISPQRPPTVWNWSPGSLQSLEGGE
jgi:phage terminase large subunit-like protein